MKGIYLLIIRVSKPVSVRVGALGVLHFPKGYYIYVGSAQNSLKNRIERHLRKDKRKHWHIDYLLEHGEVVRMLVYPNLAKSWEERIARILENHFLPIPGFGCSDTNSSSHLFLLENL